MKKWLQIFTVILILSFSVVLISHNEVSAEYAAPSNPPSVDGRYFQDSGQFGLIINDNGIELEHGLKFDQPIALSLTSTTILKIIVNDIDGWENIRFVNLYMNSNADKIHNRGLSDTQIEFDHYGLDTVIDKGNFISNVNFSSQRYDPYDRYKLEVTFEIEFSNTMEKSDMILYVIDKQGNSVERYLFNFISVVEDSVEQEDSLVETQVMVEEEEVYEIPYWVKDNAGWWSKRLISNGEFIDGIEFMIKENIISIPILENQHQVRQLGIPDWVRTTSEWWSEELVSDKEFVNSLQFLIRTGIITIPNINELISE